MRSSHKILGLVAALALATAAEAQNPTWGGGAGTPVAGHYAEVNGIKLYYEIHGTGQPLVLLHGGLGALEMFGPNLPALAQGRQVIAVDLQGHGRTADIDRPLSPQSMADDVAGLIKFLKLQRANIMGYSMGGMVALQVAIRHPEVVNRLVVASAPFRRNGFYPEILAAQQQVTAAAAEAMKPTPMYELYHRLAPRPDDWPRLLDKIGALMKVEYDWSKEIPGITARTLIIAGDADIFPPSHAVELFGLLGGGKKDAGWDGSGRPKSQLAIVPGKTHYNLFSDPELARTAIAFLAD
jgi:pimeloyl-ACP methyl ester carboxylesterase